MKTALASTVSLLVLVAAIWGLHRWLDAAGEGDFRVLSAPGPGVLEGQVMLRQVGAFRDDAVLLVDGVARPVPGDGRSVPLSADTFEPGLHTVSWEIQYMGQRARRATFTYLVGPFSSPGAPVKCGVRVRLSQRLFDALARKLASVVQETLDQSRQLPPTRGVEVTLPLGDDAIEARVKVSFEDGSEIYASQPLVILHGKNSAVRLETRGRVRADVTGTLGALAALKGGGLMAALSQVLRNPTGGIDAALEAAQQAGRDLVQRELAQQISGFVERINDELRKAMPLKFGLRLFGQQLDLSLQKCGEANYQKGRALSLRYHARVVVTPEGGPAPPNARVPGPIARIRRPLSPRAKRGIDHITLTISEDLVNAALDSAWRNGSLAALGSDPAMIRRVNARLAGVASFRIESVHLPLPPVVVLREGRATFRVGEARVALLDESGGPVQLSFVTDGELSARRDGDEFALSARPLRVVASCTEPHPEGVLRRPCYPDLLGTLDRALAQRGDWVERVPASVKGERAALILREVVVRDGALDLGARVRFFAP